MIAETFKRFALAGLLLAAVFLCGCGHSPYTETSGSVTLNGQPIEKGDIEFMPADGHGVTAAVPIEKGRYSIKAVPGNYNVRINGYHKIGERHVQEDDPTSQMMDVNEQIVPRQYNEATTLNCTVKDGGQKQDFTLTGSAEKK